MFYYNTVNKNRWKVENYKEQLVLRVVIFKDPDLFLKIVGFLVVNRYRQGILLTVYVLRREHT
ncbi:hypothetical protein C7475_103399 [Chitinophaga sp. S165]|nr:hypothetical protein C7475_103399 [Chitinophaga sp. S165]